MNKFLLAGAALAVAATGIAEAQPALSGRNATISVDDMRQRSADRFAKLDVNKDGQLSQDEMKARRGDRGHRGGRRDGGFRGERGQNGPRAGGGIFRADANRDGVVTQQEFAAQSMERFQRIDTNRDGRIAADEVQARRTQFAQRFGRGGGGFRGLDADRNGSVSRAEYDQRLGERIARLDGNRDGRITPEERQAARGRFAPQQQ